MLTMQVPGSFVGYDSSGQAPPGFVPIDYAREMRSLGVLSVRAEGE